MDKGVRMCTSTVCGAQTHTNNKKFQNSNFHAWCTLFLSHSVSYTPSLNKVDLLHGKWRNSLAEQTFKIFSQNCLSNEAPQFLLPSQSHGEGKLRKMKKKYLFFEVRVLDRQLGISKIFKPTKRKRLDSHWISVSHSFNHILWWPNQCSKSLSRSHLHSCSHFCSFNEWSQYVTHASTWFSKGILDKRDFTDKRDELRGCNMSHLSVIYCTVFSWD